MRQNTWQRLAGEQDWGKKPVEGALRKLGYSIIDETVANIIRRHLLNHRSDQFEIETKV